MSEEGRFSLKDYRRFAIEVVREIDAALAFKAQLSGQVARLRNALRSDDAAARTLHQEWLSVTTTALGYHSPRQCPHQRGSCAACCKEHVNWEHLTPEQRAVFRAMAATLLGRVLRKARLPIEGAYAMEEPVGSAEPAVPYTDPAEETPR